MESSGGGDAAQLPAPFVGTHSHASAMAQASCRAQLPAPLVGTHVDLTGYPGFVLDVDVLLNSELVAVGSPEECWAAFLLWCKSWRQSPPASLPDDDRVLAAFSGSGERWSQVKAMALRGFVKCSDGRLYHKLLATKANSAWESRRNASTRGKAGSEARWSKKRTKGKGTPKVGRPQSLPDAPAMAQASGLECLGDGVSIPDQMLEPSQTHAVGNACSWQVEVKLKETTTATDNPSSSALHPVTSDARAQPEISNTTRLAVELRTLGVQITPAHPALTEWLGKATHAQVLEAVAIARTRKKDGQIPALYLSPIVNDIVSGSGGSHATNRGGGGSSGASIQAAGFAQLAAKQRNGAG